MSWSEGRIARAISRQTLARKCVVLVDRCNWTGYECDVLAVTGDLRIIDVEVKISRGDLKADRHKDKWWLRTPWYRGLYDRAPAPPPQPRAWPPKVWKHYYAMPADIWKDELLAALPSTASGVLLVAEQRGSQTLSVTCRRRATPNKHADKLSAEQVLDIARLANLRMWDAYEAAEQAKTEAVAA